MKDEYPTKEELRKIEKWDITKKPVTELISYVEKLWWDSDWGFKLSGKRILKLELHTGGWSGNESIVGALGKNFLFWMLYWERSTRGGHFYFKIPLKLFRVKK